VSPSITSDEGGADYRSATSIVRKPPDQVSGTAASPGGRRFFARINNNRRLAKHVEASIASATAFLYAACVILLSGPVLVRSI
jgi:hypothetical protein